MAEQPIASSKNKDTQSIQIIHKDLIYPAQLLRLAQSWSLGKRWPSSTGPSIIYLNIQSSNTTSGVNQDLEGARVNTYSKGVAEAPEL